MAKVVHVSSHYIEKSAPSAHFGEKLIPSPVTAWSKSSKESLNNVKHLVQEIEKYAADGVNKLLVGNKGTVESAEPVDLMPADEEPILSYEGMQTVATGCAPDYFGSEFSSIRLVQPVKEMNHYVSCLKSGVMVLHYAADKFDYKFRRRLLKVDEQLRFLYLMDANVTAADMSKKVDKKLILMSIPLSHVGHVFDMGDALNIFEYHHMPLHGHVELEERYAIWIDPDSKPPIDLEHHNKVPHLSKMLIVLADRDLSTCIYACKDFVQGTSSNNSNRRRVDDIVLPSVDVLMDPCAASVSFEVSFRNTQSIRPVCIEMCTSKTSNFGGVKDKLEEELFPIDVERAVFVIRDATSIRAAVLDAGEKMKVGLADYITNWRHIGEPWPNEEDSLAEFIQRMEADRQVAMNRRALKASLLYTEASGRSIISAFTHLLELEEQFQDIFHRAEHMSEEDDASERTEHMSEEDEASERDYQDSTMPDDLCKGTWTCLHCGYINGNVKVCAICDEAKEEMACTQNSLLLSNPPRVLETAVQRGELQAAFQAASKGAAKQVSWSDGWGPVGFMRTKAVWVPDATDLAATNTEANEAAPLLRHPWDPGLPADDTDIVLVRHPWDLRNRRDDAFEILDTPSPGAMKANTCTAPLKRRKGKKSSSNTILSCTGGRSICTGGRATSKEQCSLQ